MIPRMRTINEAAAEMREADPHTAVTPHFIRQLILAGKVPHVKAGNKYLVNLDGLQEYLANPSTVEGTILQPMHRIRRISER